MLYLLFMSLITSLITTIIIVLKLILLKVLCTVTLFQLYLFVLKKKLKKTQTGRAIFHATGAGFCTNDGSGTPLWCCSRHTVSYSVQLCQAFV